MGLNFYQESKRFLSSLQERELASVVPCLRVGLFVNSPRDDILAIRERNSLDAIQLHGDESPEFLSELSGLPIIRARRMDGHGVAAIAEDLKACRDAGREPDAILVDALSPGSYGGTGETVSWAGLTDYREWLGEVPLILAGGLTPDNVAEAIRIVRPDGVDVASGVESSPGVKCPEKMRLFVQRAKSAFDAL